MIVLFRWAVSFVSFCRICPQAGEDVVFSQQAWGSVFPLACVLWLLTYFSLCSVCRPPMGDDDNDKNSLSEHLLRGSRSQFQVLFVYFLIFRFDRTQ